MNRSNSSRPFHALSFERRVGYTQNLYRTRESIANTMNALVLGIIGGFPPGVFVLSVSISFALGICADIPTGIIADRFGHVRAFLIGMICVAIAPLLLLLPILSDLSEQLSTLIVIVNAIIFSFGQTMLSGSYEAYVYGMVEVLQGGSEDPSTTRTLDLTGITKLQKFGSYLPLLVPSATITAALVLERYTSFGYICLLVPSIISLWLIKYARDSKHEHHGTKQATDTKIVLEIISEKSFRDKFSLALIPLIFLLFLYQITIVQTNAYTLVSMLRIESLNSMNIITFIGHLLAASSFFIGYFVKAQLGSIFVEKVSFKKLVYLLPAAAALLALTSYLLLSVVGAYVALFLFGVFSRLFQSSGQELVMSYVLKHLNANRRATVLSVARTLAVGGYAIFSWFLVWSGLGVPSLASIFISVALLSCLICVSTLLLQWGYIYNT